MIVQEAPVFDATRYKATTLQQWDVAAAAWDHWSPLLREWLGEATELMLDMAGVQAGSRVLDVAAGAGDQSLQAAARVGAEGEVLATDISPRILEHAAAQARNAGFSNVRTEVHDGEHLDVAEASFDAVISRLGLIYFPDQQHALRGMKRALKPGGRVAAIVYSTPDRNGFFVGAGLDHPRPCGAAGTPSGPARSVQPGRRRRARSVVQEGRLLRRQ